MDKKRYVKDITRINFSLFDVKAWHLGESEELRKAIGFGFNETVFLSRDDSVTVYYSKEESDRFYEILDKVLTEDFFHELCDDFVIIVDKFKPKTEEEVFTFLVKTWPAYVVFQEISHYPEYATQGMLRRLFRIRKATESYSYELAKKIKADIFPKNYLYFKGAVIRKPFEVFCEENNITVENG